MSENNAVGFGGPGAAAGPPILPITQAGLEPIELVEEIEDAENSYVQSVPAMVWTIGHSLGHTPTQVAVIQDDDPVDVEVTANSTNINVFFASPVSGRATFI